VRINIARAGKEQVRRLGITLTQSTRVLLPQRASQQQWLPLSSHLASFVDVHTRGIDAVSIFCCTIFLIPERDLPVQKRQREAPIARTRIQETDMPR
jgi:hypothetical protein